MRVGSVRLRSSSVQWGWPSGPRWDTAESGVAWPSCRPATPGHRPAAATPGRRLCNVFGSAHEAEKINQMFRKTPSETRVFVTVLHTMCLAPALFFRQKCPPTWHSENIQTMTKQMNSNSQNSQRDSVLRRCSCAPPDRAVSPQTRPVPRHAQAHKHRCSPSLSRAS